MNPSASSRENVLRSKAFGLKALVVDFDSDSLDTLDSFLRELGMEIHTARDGLSGLEMFRTHKPHVVLLEAMLPKMSGFELSKQIQIESRGRVPVIMITGVYKDVRHKIEATKIYGVAAFLTKPWKKDELETTLLNLIGPASQATSIEDELISENLEDLSAIIKKDTQPLSPKVAPSATAPENKKLIDKKSSQIREEVDKLLEQTLADLGFSARKQASAAEKTAPAASPITSPAAPEKKESDLKNLVEKTKEKGDLEIRNTPPKPRAASVLSATKEEVSLVTTLISPTEDKVEEKTEAEIVPVADTMAVRPSVPSPFLLEERQAEKKPRPAALILGITAAAALFIMAVFLLKPKKPASTALRETTAPVAIQTASSEPGQSVPSRLEEQEVAPKLPTAKEPMPEVSKPSEPQKKQEDVVAKEEPPPVIPAEAPRITPPVLEVKTEAFQESTNIAEKTIEGAGTAASTTPLKAEPRVQIKEGDLVPLSEVDVPPRVIKTVEPKYPPIAVHMGLEGSVVVNALISENGDVIRTEILRGIKNGAVIEQAAQNAIRQWKFSPAMKGGVRVKVWKPIESRFRLK